MKWKPTSHSADFSKEFSVQKVWRAQQEATRLAVQVEWRPQRDSNPRFGLERATFWASGRWGHVWEGWTRDHNTRSHGVARPRLTIRHGCKRRLNGITERIARPASPSQALA